MKTTRESLAWRIVHACVARRALSACLLGALTLLGCALPAQAATLTNPDNVYQGHVYLGHHFQEHVYLGHHFQGHVYLGHHFQ